VLANRPTGHPCTRPGHARQCIAGEGVLNRRNDIRPVPRPRGPGTQGLQSSRNWLSPSELVLKRRDIARPPSTPVSACHGALTGRTTSLSRVRVPGSTMIMVLRRKVPNARVRPRKRCG
jgi:hypothetical protein